MEQEPQRAADHMLLMVRSDSPVCSVMRAHSISGGERRWPCLKVLHPVDDCVFNKGQAVRTMVYGLSMDQQPRLPKGGSASLSRGQ